MHYKNYIYKDILVFCAPVACSPTRRFEAFNETIFCFVIIFFKKIWMCILSYKWMDPRGGGRPGTFLVPTIYQTSYMVQNNQTKII